MKPLIYIVGLDTLDERERFHVTTDNPDTIPNGERVIGIQIGPVPQFRSVRGRGVTRIEHCGHPSRTFGLCVLAPGHAGAHVYGARKPEDQTA